MTLTARRRQSTGPTLVPNGKINSPGRPAPVPSAIHDAASRPATDAVLGQHHVLAVEADEALLLAADTVLAGGGVYARDQILAVELVITAIGIVFAHRLAGRQLAAAVAQHRHHALVGIEYDQPARLRPIRRMHQLAGVVVRKRLDQAPGAHDSFHLSCSVDDEANLLDQLGYSSGKPSTRQPGRAPPCALRCARSGPAQGAPTRPDQHGRGRSRGRAAPRSPWRRPGS